MIAAIGAFHEVALGPAAPELPALVRALDALAMAYTTRRKARRRNRISILRRPTTRRCAPGSGRGSRTLASTQWLTP